MFFARKHMDLNAGDVTAIAERLATGSYRYRKLRGSGASLMIDVDVFPLAMTRELDACKSQVADLGRQEGDYHILFYLIFDVYEVLRRSAAEAGT